jgi:hypothetical protein
MFSIYSDALTPSVCKKLPITFISKVKNMDKVDGPDADKTDLIKLEFFMDPCNAAGGSKYSQHFAIFKD